MNKKIAVTTVLIGMACIIVGLGGWILFGEDFVRGYNDEINRVANPTPERQCTWGFVCLSGFEFQCYAWDYDEGRIVMFDNEDSLVIASNHEKYDFILVGQDQIEALTRTREHFCRDDWY